MAVQTVTFSINGTGTFATTPKLTIDWTGSPKDTNWTAWNVYRRITGTLGWTLMASITPHQTRTWDDWTVPSNIGVQYAVTQATNAPDESAKVPSSDTVANSAEYWFVVPDDPTFNTKLFNVHDDEFEDDVEVTAVNLLGRGRRVEHGDDFGVTGTLEVSFLDQTGLTARQQMLAVKALHHVNGDVYLRNPFGDVWAVHPAGISITRMAGVGQREFSTASIPYSQVTA